MPDTRLRLVFAGTPEFAVPSLASVLDSGHTLSAVYTQPDRPAGRGRKPAPSPVKQAALAADIPVRQPESLRDGQVQAELAELAPDLMIVVAYGLILPRKVLAIPRHGCWNVHASLLPRWRGAAPIQRAILAGDEETGVCLMQMAAGLDTGPVLLSEGTDITDADTGASLHDRLADMGAQLVAEGLHLLTGGVLPPAVPQHDAGVTYADKLDKAESQLDWRQPADQLARKVRAFEPWPGTEAEIAGERLRIWQARSLADADADVPSHDQPAGTILRASRDGIDIACGQGVLRVLGVQRPGRGRISAGDYLNARPDLARPA